mmetsp:Transcript_103878/g.294300  ORF Transcript_103878/g.294300 Transcript_103878/m.294300 type:complete len:389 (-) Transcript_103878:3-1169(-)
MLAIRLGYGREEAAERGAPPVLPPRGELEEGGRPARPHHRDQVALPLLPDDLGRAAHVLELPAQVRARHTGPDKRLHDRPPPVLGALRHQRLAHVLQHCPLAWPPVLGRGPEQRLRQVPGQGVGQDVEPVARQVAHLPLALQAVGRLRLLHHPLGASELPQLQQRCTWQDKLLEPVGLQHRAHLELLRVVPTPPPACGLRPAQDPDLALAGHLRGQLVGGHPAGLVVAVDVHVQPLPPRGHVHDHGGDDVQPEPVVAGQAGFRQVPDAAVPEAPRGEVGAEGPVPAARGGHRAGHGVRVAAGQLGVPVDDNVPDVLGRRRSVARARPHHGRQLHGLLVQQRRGMVAAGVMREAGVRGLPLGRHLRATGGAANCGQRRQSPAQSVSRAA